MTLIAAHQHGMNHHPLSLSRAKRIQKSTDIKMLYQFSHHFLNDCWEIFTLKKPILTYSRLAVIVSKKVSLHAVERNRIKRLAKEYWRKSHFRFQCITDYLILAKPKCMDQNNIYLTNQLEKLLLSKDKYEQ